MSAPFSTGAPATPLLALIVVPLSSGAHRLCEVMLQGGEGGVHHKRYQEAERYTTMKTQYIF